MSVKTYRFCLRAPSSRSLQKLLDPSVSPPVVAATVNPATVEIDYEETELGELKEAMESFCWEFHSEVIP